MMNNINILLREIGQHPDGVTVTTLALLSGRSHAQVLDSCAVLRRHGLVYRPSMGVYCLTDAGRSALAAQLMLHPGPNSGTSLMRRSTLRARLWQALRQSQKATVQDLLKIAELEDDDDHNALKNAQKYLRLLERSGFVVRLRRQAGTAPSSNGYIRWSLIRNTGPNAPSAHPGAGHVFDHNTRTVHPLHPINGRTA